MRKITLAAVCLLAMAMVFSAVSYAEEADAFGGGWLEKDTEFTQLTVVQNGEDLWEIEAVSPMTHGAYVFKAAAHADGDALVYTDGSLYPLTAEGEAADSPIAAGTAGSLRFEADDLVWEDGAVPGTPVRFERSEAAGMANPWSEGTAEELTQATGLTFGVPEGAESVLYRWLDGEGLAEMQFTLEGDEFCARIQPAAEPTNISDIFYAWEDEEAVTVGHCEGTLGLAQTGSEEWVELCQWYDAAPGLMYSLAVHTVEPDGLDLIAVAEQVYLPVQGND